MQGITFDIAHMLAGSLVLVSFIQLYQQRLSALLNIFALHAFVLAASVAWQAYVQDAPHLYITALIALVFKAIVIPLALRRIVIKLGIHREIENVFGVGLAMLLGIGLVALSMVVMLLIPVFVVLAAQLRVDDAARVAARSAARGNDDEATSLANQSAPRATVDIERGDGRVHVSVRESVSLPIPGLGAIDIHANSLVRDEVSLSEGFDE